MPRDFSVLCPCGCGQPVKATDAGFAATTVTVECCPASVLGTITVRKSWAYSAAVPAATSSRHVDGLVVFG